MLKSEKGFTPLVIVFVLMVLTATFSSFIIEKTATPKQVIEPTVKPTPLESPQISPSNIGVSQSSPSTSPLKFKVNVVLDDDEHEDFEKRENESDDR